MLKQDSARGTESRASHRLRSGLLAAEVALTLTLSVTAVLLAQQLAAASRQELGFSADRLVTLDTHAAESIALPELEKTAAPEQISAALAPLQQRSLARLDAALATVASTPGVASAAAIDNAPMGAFNPDVSYAVRGRQVFAPGTEHMPDANIRSVTPGLFSTLHIPLLRGRALAPSDREGAPPVLLISRQLAREVFRTRIRRSANHVRV